MLPLFARLAIATATPLLLETRPPNRSRAAGLPSVEKISRGA